MVDRWAAIKDYSETLGTQNSPPLSAASPWSTTALAPSDLTTPSVSFYWVPSAAQFEPNNGPFTRNVTLNVTQSGGGSCSATAALTVERDESDITRQAEDFYTSNHRAATETNPLDGRMVDEHIFWHENIDGNLSFPNWMHFLAWHGEFVRRFDSVAPGVRLQSRRTVLSGAARSAARNLMPMPVCGSLTWPTTITFPPTTQSLVARLLTHSAAAS